MLIFATIVQLFLSSNPDTIQLFIDREERGFSSASGLPRAQIERLNKLPEVMGIADIYDEIYLSYGCGDRLDTLPMDIKISGAGGRKPDTIRIGPGNEYSENNRIQRLIAASRKLSKKLRGNSIFRIRYLIRCADSSDKISDTSSRYRKIQDGGALLLQHKDHLGDTIKIHGHPLGAIFLDFWVNDSIAIIESGCCESKDYFRINLPRKSAYHYYGEYCYESIKEMEKNLKNEMTANDQTYSILEEGCKKEKVNFEKLIWNRDRKSRKK